MSYKTDLIITDVVTNKKSVTKQLTTAKPYNQSSVMKRFNSYHYLLYYIPIKYM